MSSGDATRVFWAKRPSEEPRNENTVIAAASSIFRGLSAFRSFPRLAGLDPSTGDTSLLEPLRKFYDPVRDWLSHCQAPGLAVVAVDGDGLQAKAYLKAKRGLVNTAIVGRHGKAEVYVGADPSVSLRHLAVVVHPGSSKESVRFRVLDLRTSYGFADVQGTLRRAVETNDPFFARCGKYSIVFAPVTEPATDWPDHVEELRDAFPFDVLSSPESFERLSLEAGEDPLGELVVSSPRCTGSVPVTRGTVGAGILLGRSHRCDGQGLLAERHISRVHLLIVDLAGSLWAIDTASKNGTTFAPGGAERVAALESGTKISLSGVATVEWQFFH